MQNNKKINKKINTIHHNIRNFRELTNEQQEYIKNNLTDEEKTDIILLYNEIVKSYSEYFNDNNK